MTRIIRPCCSICYPKDYLYYIQVANKGNLKIMFIVQYTLNGETVTKNSAIFGRGISLQIPFSAYAQNLCISIINESIPQRLIILNTCINPLRRACFEVIGTKELPFGNEVRC